MADGIRDYDKLEHDHANRSYTELKRAATRVIEKRRLQQHRDNMQQSLTGGGAMAAKGKGKARTGQRGNRKRAKIGDHKKKVKLKRYKITKQYAGYT